MAVVEALDNLGCVESGQLLIKSTFLCNELTESAVFAVFKDKVKTFGVHESHLEVDDEV